MFVSSIIGTHTALPVWRSPLIYVLQNFVKKIAAGKTIAPWEENSYSSGQEIIHLYGNRRFIQCSKQPATGLLSWARQVYSLPFHLAPLRSTFNIMLQPQVLCILSSSMCATFPAYSNLLNVLNPTGHVMHQQFNIQQLYALPTLYLCVVYLSEHKQRLVPLTS